MDSRRYAYPTSNSVMQNAVVGIESRYRGRSCIESPGGPITVQRRRLRLGDTRSKLPGSIFMRTRPDSRSRSLRTLLLPVEAFRMSTCSSRRKRLRSRAVAFRKEPTCTRSAHLARTAWLREMTALAITVFAAGKSRPGERIARAPSRITAGSAATTRETRLIPQGA